METCVNYVELLSPQIPELQINLCVARGLDYYTGMVFEVHVPELGGEGQVLGGVLHKLLHLFGLPDLDPSCGFGLGFDRIMLALEAQNDKWKSRGCTRRIGKTKPIGSGSVQC